MGVLTLLTGSAAIKSIAHLVFTCFFNPVTSNLTFLNRSRDYFFCFTIVTLVKARYITFSVSQDALSVTLKSFEFKEKCNINVSRLLGLCLKLRGGDLPSCFRKGLHHRAQQIKLPYHTKWCTYLRNVWFLNQSLTQAIFNLQFFFKYQWICLLDTIPTVYLTFFYYYWFLSY